MDADLDLDLDLDFDFEFDLSDALVSPPDLALTALELLLLFSDLSSSLAALEPDLVEPFSPSSSV